MIVKSVHEIRSRIHRFLLGGLPLIPTDGCFLEEVSDGFCLTTDASNKYQRTKGYSRYSTKF